MQYTSSYKAQSKWTTRKHKLKTKVINICISYIPIELNIDIDMYEHLRLISEP